MLRDSLFTPELILAVLCLATHSLIGGQEAAGRCLQPLSHSKNASDLDHLSDHVCKLSH